MELYSAILKLAPLLLLKLFAKGFFGPAEQSEGKRGRMALASDVILVVSVVAAGFIAALVVGDVVPSSAVTRWTVVLAGCLSLLLLAVWLLREIASLYRARQPSRGLATPSGASPGEAA